MKVEDSWSTISWCIVLVCILVIMWVLGEITKDLTSLTNSLKTNPSRVWSLYLEAKEYETNN